MFISNYEKHLLAKTIGSVTKNIVGLTSSVENLFKVDKVQQKNIENLVLLAGELVTKVNELEDRIALLEGKNV